ncbi:MAG: hypothetical protein EBW30_04840 [Synechococcaceae bacterium WB7_3xG_012]|nr:hypothetical protein [Synechococcaceae bacterium WB7_3xG_012]
MNSFMSDASTTTQIDESLVRGDWEARLSSELESLEELAAEVDGEAQALLLLLRLPSVDHPRSSLPLGYACSFCRLHHASDTSAFLTGQAGEDLIRDP